MLQTFSGYRIHYVDRSSLPRSVLGNFTSLFLYLVQICPEDPMPQGLQLWRLSTSFSNEKVLIGKNIYGQYYLRQLLLLSWRSNVANVINCLLAVKFPKYLHHQTSEQLSKEIFFYSPIWKDHIQKSRSWTSPSLRNYVTQLLM